MRRIALFSLALLPAIAYGQATTATGAATATPAANLEARASVAPAFSANTVAAASRPLRNVVSVVVNRQPERPDGSITYTLSMGGQTSSAATTLPVLTHIVSVGVNDIASNKADVSIHMIVDEHGVPTNLKIARSAGAELDGKTLAAVSQYRFQPATYDRLPTNADVTVDVKLQK